MNTISSLEPTDLPAALQIEKRAHAFPWSEKTFASNQGDRYLNFQLRVDDVMAAFAITQVVLDDRLIYLQHFRLKNAPTLFRGVKKHLPATRAIATSIFS